MYIPDHTVYIGFRTYVCILQRNFLWTILPRKPLFCHLREQTWLFPVLSSALPILHEPTLLLLTSTPSGEFLINDYLRTNDGRAGQTPLQHYRDSDSRASEVKQHQRHTEHEPQRHPQQPASLLQKLPQRLKINGHFGPGSNTSA